MKVKATSPKERFESFVKEMNELSIKHNIIVRSVGGVFQTDTEGMEGFLGYSEDHTSGDLIPNWSEV